MQIFNVPLVERLTELEKAQMVRQAADSEPSYLFKHALIQDAVYASLLHGTRIEMHRRVAEAMEVLWQGQLDSHAAFIQMHYEKGGFNYKAFQYAVRAGQWAARAFAHVEALSFFDRALRLGSYPAAPENQSELTKELRRVYVQKGRVFEVMGDFPAAEQNYREMIRFAEQSDDAAMEADSLNHLVTAQVVRGGATSETDAQLGRALELAQQSGNSELIARTLWNRGLAYRFTEPERAADDLEQALGLAEAHNLRQLAANVRLDLHVALALLGRGRQARYCAQQALAEFRALDLKPMITDALEAVAYYAYCRAESAQARELAKEGLRLSQAIENPWGVVNNQIQLLVLELAAGHLSHVLLEGETVLTATRQIGIPPFALTAYGLLTQVWLELAQPERARALTNEAAGAFAGMQGSPFPVWASWLQAMPLLKSGELAGAHVLMPPVTGRRMFPLNPFDRYGGVTYTVAELALLEGRLDDGLELCNSILLNLEEQEQLGLAAGMYYWRARMHMARGDPARTEEDGLRASVLLERAENRILLWRAQGLLAELYRAQGKDSLALYWQEQAVAIIQYIAEQVPVEWRQGFLHSVEVRHVTDGVGKP